MVLSFAATNIQLGLLRHAGVVMDCLEIVPTGYTKAYTYHATMPASLKNPPLGPS
jgi:hypothetical protein